MSQQPGNALITGAGSGLGKELARQLARAGWSIAALDAEGEGLAALAEELRRRDATCQTKIADVTDATNLRLQVEAFENELGPIDLAIACAGVADETPGQWFDPVDIEKVIRIDLIGVANTLAAVTPAMLARRRGHLVAVSSLASLRSLPRMMAYCASKAGVNALMESLRLDVAPYGIHVTTVCPGWTRTPQTEGRFRRSELLSVEDSAAEIMWAIARRRRFHAFPRSVVWQLRLLQLLPRRVQDWILCRRLAALAVGADDPSRQPSMSNHGSHE